MYGNMIITRFEHPPMQYSGGGGGGAGGGGGGLVKFSLVENALDSIELGL